MEWPHPRVITLKSFDKTMNSSVYSDTWHSEILFRKKKKINKKKKLYFPFDSSLVIPWNSVLLEYSQLFWHTSPKNWTINADVPSLGLPFNWLEKRREIFPANRRRVRLLNDYQFIGQLRRITKIFPTNFSKFKNSHANTLGLVSKHRLN